MSNTAANSQAPVPGTSPNVGNETFGSGYSKEEKPVEAKVRELYLAAFSREPRSQELKIAIDYLNEPGTDANANYQDLIWALINTKEFLFNH